MVEDLAEPRLSAVDCTRRETGCELAGLNHDSMRCLVISSSVGSAITGRRVFGRRA